MIVRFSVSNFLSFDYSSKPKDCINMRPSRIKQKGNHIAHGDCNLLRTMVMFGGNGAGKSSIVKALNVLKKIVTIGILPRPNDMLYCRNKLDNKTRPIRFEIEIIKKQSPSDIGFEIDCLRKSIQLKTTELEYAKSWSHYKYCIELGYVEDNKPYSINYESGSVLDFDGRSIWGFENNNDGTKDQKQPSRGTGDYWELRKERICLLEKIDESKKGLEEKIRKYELLKKREYDIKKRLHEAEFDSKRSDSELRYKQFSLLRAELNVEWESIRAESDNLRRIIREVSEDIDRNQIREKAIKGEIKKIEIEISADKLRNTRTFREIPMVFDLISESVLYRRSRGRQSTIDWRGVKVANEIHDWFLNTLVLVSIKGKVTPSNCFDDLKRINDLLPMFDAHIKGLIFEPVVKSNEVEDMFDETSIGRSYNLFEFMGTNTGRQSSITKIVNSNNNIFQLNFRESKIFANKLKTIHFDDTIHELIEESDGTRRLIELISILVETEAQKVYVIDELDRRLHPLITKNFIEMYHQLKQSLENTQLIITTHETRLISTEIFRMDEINFVERDENYSTVVRRASDVVVDKDKKLDELYLNRVLGGVPIITDLDDV